MFEQTPSNLPISKEPEDILEKVLPTAPSAPRAASPPASPKSPPLPQETMVIETPRQGMIRFIFVLGLVLGLAVVGGASWFFIRKAVNKTPAVSETPTLPTTSEPVAPEVIPPPAEEILPPPPPEIPPTPAVLQAAPDSDGDGLADAVEAQMGTNPNLIDSDNDGLTDFEEVNIYRTNPSNPDTDGDKYLDGKEVRGGYDPNVAGK